MFDLYLIHVIGNAFKYYSADRSLFDPLFPHVADAMRDRMWEYLQSNTIRFDSSYNARTAKNLPLITIEDNEQFFDQQGLSNTAGEYVDENDQVVRVSSLFTSHEAVINVYADNLEAVRVLEAVIHAGMLIFHPFLVSASFQNVMYVGSTSLVPDPNLIGENLSTYGRQLRYAALHLREIVTKLQQLDNIGALDPVYTVQVQADDQTPSGSVIGGGVAV
jgi:hypothetical protein